MGERGCCCQLRWFQLLRHAVRGYRARIRHGGHRRRHHQGRHGQHLYDVKFVSPWWKLRGAVSSRDRDESSEVAGRRVTLDRATRSLLVFPWYPTRRSDRGGEVISGACGSCEVNELRDLPRDFVDDRSRGRGHGRTRSRLRGGSSTGVSVPRAVASLDWYYLRIRAARRSIRSRSSTMRDGVAHRIAIYRVVT